jgi:FkbM family methyltransferase
LHENTSKSPEVTIETVAIGNKNGKADFYINSYDQASSLLRLNSNNQVDILNLKETKKIRVKISTLDNIFSDRSLEKPVLMKIDVQGSEKLVIEGGQETLNRVDYVLMETSFKPMYTGEILFMEMLEVMRNNNYIFIRPINFLKNPKTAEIL